MAPTFRRSNKNLVCFYCNKKSGIKYDGLLTQWECPQCDSVNFLDENGEITDPPVATESAASNLLRYNIAPVNSQETEVGDQLFCATCVKNQHLYTASLAQYHVEPDPTHPRYKEMEREYFAYRKNLERLYPQVCEACEPKVLARLRDAGRTAKADHLRRAMDKSRQRRIGGGGSKLSFAGFVEGTGKCLWYTGAVGQLFWNLVTLALPGVNPSWLGYMHVSAPPEAMDVLPNIYFLAGLSLLCSIVSIWWNPMFKQMNKGFTSHVSGFGKWYKLQALSILVRLIFYKSSISSPALSSHPASIGAHGVVLVFTSMIVMLSHRSLKVDLAPLWEATPERLSHVGPRSSESARGVDSMADILDQMSATPSRGPRAPVPTNSSKGLGSKSTAQRRGQEPDMFSSLSLAPQRMSNQSGSSFLSLDPPSRRSSGNSGNGSMQIQQRQQDPDEIEEMEWTPTNSQSQPQSQHRAFNSPGDIQRTSGTFGHAPVMEQPSPFWYKAPAAPITPAQKLRNPPNRPALQVSSQGVKENFFNRVTHRLPASKNEQSALPMEGTPRSEIAFAPQKFFAPPTPGEAGNTLADLLTSFSLGGSEEEVPPQQVERVPWKRQTVKCIVILLSHQMWTYAVRHSWSVYALKFMLLDKLVCLGLGVRNVYDCILPSPKKPHVPPRYLGATISCAESAVAVYLLVELLTGRCTGNLCHAMGSFLNLAMLAHRLLVTPVDR